MLLEQLMKNHFHSNPPPMNFLALWENHQLSDMDIKQVLIVQRLFQVWYDTYFTKDKNDSPTGVEYESKTTRNPNI
jgi:hypothetical protein